MKGTCNLKNRGFTLVEMIVVVALFAIVLAAFESSFSHAFSAERWGISEINAQLRSMNALKKVATLLRQTGPATGVKYDGSGDSWDYPYISDDNQICYFVLPKATHGVYFNGTEIDWDTRYVYKISTNAKRELFLEKIDVTTSSPKVLARDLLALGVNKITFEDKDDDSINLKEYEFRITVELKIPRSGGVKGGFKGNDYITVKQRLLHVKMRNIIKQLE